MNEIDSIQADQTHDDTHNLEAVDRAENSTNPNDNKEELIELNDFNESQNDNEKDSHQKDESVPRELLRLCIDMDWWKEKASGSERSNGLDLNHKKGSDYYQHKDKQESSESQSADQPVSEINEIPSPKPLKSERISSELKKDAPKKEKSKSEARKKISSKSLKLKKEKIKIRKLRAFKTKSMVLKEKKFKSKENLKFKKVLKGHKIKGIGKYKDKYKRKEKYVGKVKDKEIKKLKKEKNRESKKEREDLVKKVRKKRHKSKDLKSHGAASRLVKRPKIINKVDKVLLISSLIEKQKLLLSLLEKSAVLSNTCNNHSVSPERVDASLSVKHQEEEGPECDFHIDLKAARELKEYPFDPEGTLRPRSAISFYRLDSEDNLSLTDLVHSRKKMDRCSIELYKGIFQVNNVTDYGSVSIIPVNESNKYTLSKYVVTDKQPSPRSELKEMKDTKQMCNMDKLKNASCFMYEDLGLYVSENEVYLCLVIKNLSDNTYVFETKRNRNQTTQSIDVKSVTRVSCNSQQLDQKVNGDSRQEPITENHLKNYICLLFYVKEGVVMPLVKSVTEASSVRVYDDSVVSENSMIKALRQIVSCNLNFQSQKDAQKERDTAKKLLYQFCHSSKDGPLSFEDCQCLGCHLSIQFLTGNSQYYLSQQVDAKVKQNSKYLTFRVVNVLMQSQWTKETPRLKLEERTTPSSLSQTSMETVKSEELSPQISSENEFLEDLTLDAAHRITRRMNKELHSLETTPESKELKPVGKMKKDPPKRDVVNIATTPTRLDLDEKVKETQTQEEESAKRRKVSGSQGDSPRSQLSHTKTQNRQASISKKQHKNESMANKNQKDPPIQKPNKESQPKIEKVQNSPSQNDLPNQSPTISSQSLSETPNPKEAKQSQKGEDSPVKQLPKQKDQTQQTQKTQKIQTTPPEPKRFSERNLKLQQLREQQAEQERNQELQPQSEYALSRLRRHTSQDEQKQKQGLQSEYSLTRLRRCTAPEQESKDSVKEEEHNQVQVSPKQPVQPKEQKDQAEPVVKVDRTYFPQPKLIQLIDINQGFQYVGFLVKYSALDRDPINKKSREWTYGVIKFWDPKYKSFFVHTLRDDFTDSMTDQQLYLKIKTEEVVPFAVKVLWVATHTCFMLALGEEPVFNRFKAATSVDSQAEGGTEHVSTPHCKVCKKKILYIRKDFTKLPKTCDMKECDEKVQMSEFISEALGTYDYPNYLFRNPVHSTVLALRELEQIGYSKIVNMLASNLDITSMLFKDFDRSSVNLYNRSTVYFCVKLIHWLRKHCGVTRRLEATSNLNLVYWGFKCSSCNEYYHAKCLQYQHLRKPSPVMDKQRINARVSEHKTICKNFRLVTHVRSSYYSNENLYRSKDFKLDIESEDDLELFLSDRSNETINYKRYKAYRQKKRKYRKRRRYLMKPSSSEEEDEINQEQTEESEQEVSESNEGLELEGEEVDVARVIDEGSKSVNESEVDYEYNEEKDKFASDLVNESEGEDGNDGDLDENCGIDDQMRSVSDEFESEVDVFEGSNQLVDVESSNADNSFMFNEVNEDGHLKEAQIDEYNELNDENEIKMNVDVYDEDGVDNDEVTVVDDEYEYLAENDNDVENVENNSNDDKYEEYVENDEMDRDVEEGGARDEESEKTDGEMNAENYVYYPMLDYSTESNEWRCPDCRTCVYCCMPITERAYISRCNYGYGYNESSMKSYKQFPPCFEQKVDHLQRNCLQTDKVKDVMCVSCNISAHRSCCNPIVPNLLFIESWKCDSCTQCISCGYRDATCIEYLNWGLFFFFCLKCWELLERSNYCGICYKVWTNFDSNTQKWVQCEGCKLWIHVECDDLARIIAECPSSKNQNYRCCVCRSSNKMTRCMKVLEQIFIVDKPNQFRYPVSPTFVTYWRLVTKPMNLVTLFTKLEGCKYTSISEFIFDIFLIPYNAKMVNMPNTKIYKFAIVFEKKCKQIVSSIMQISNAEIDAIINSGLNGGDVVEATKILSTVEEEEAEVAKEQECDPKEGLSIKSELSKSEVVKRKIYRKLESKRTLKQSNQFSTIKKQLATFNMTFEFMLGRIFNFHEGMCEEVVTSCFKECDSDNSGKTTEAFNRLTHDKTLVDFRNMCSFYKSYVPCGMNYAVASVVSVAGPKFVFPPTFDSNEDFRALVRSKNLIMLNKNKPKNMYLEQLINPEKVTRTEESYEFYLDSTKHLDSMAKMLFTQGFVQFRDFCVVCGSNAFQSYIIHCEECGEPMHYYCAGFALPPSLLDYETFRCSGCTHCNRCLGEVGSNHPYDISNINNFHFGDALGFIPALVTNIVLFSSQVILDLAQNQSNKPELNQPDSDKEKEKSEPPKVKYATFLDGRFKVDQNGLITNMSEPADFDHLSKFPVSSVKCITCGNVAHLSCIKLVRPPTNPYSPYAKFTNQNQPCTTYHAYAKNESDPSDLSTQSGCTVEDFDHSFMRFSPELGPIKDHQPVLNNSKRVNGDSFEKLEFLDGWFGDLKPSEQKCEYRADASKCESVLMKKFHHQKLVRPEEIPDSDEMTENEFRHVTSMSKKLSVCDDLISIIQSHINSGVVNKTNGFNHPATTYKLLFKSHTYNEEGSDQISNGSESSMYTNWECVDENEEEVRLNLDFENEKKKTSEAYEHEEFESVNSIGNDSEVIEAKMKTDVKEEMECERSGKVEEPPSTSDKKENKKYQLEEMKDTPRRDKLTTFFDLKSIFESLNQVKEEESDQQDKSSNANNVKEQKQYTYECKPFLNWDFNGSGIFTCNAECQEGYDAVRQCCFPHDHLYSSSLMKQFEVLQETYGLMKLEGEDMNGVSMSTESVEKSENEGENELEATYNYTQTQHMVSDRGSEEALNISLTSNCMICGKPEKHTTELNSNQSSDHCKDRDNIVLPGSATNWKMCGSCKSYRRYMKEVLEKMGSEEVDEDVEAAENEGTGDLVLSTLSSSAHSGVLSAARKSVLMTESTLNYLITIISTLAPQISNSNLKRLVYEFMKYHDNSQVFQSTYKAMIGSPFSPVVFTNWRNSILGYRRHRKLRELGLKEDSKQCLARSFYKVSSKVKLNGRVKERRYNYSRNRFMKASHNTMIRRFADATSGTARFYWIYRDLLAYKMFFKNLGIKKRLRKSSPYYQYNKRSLHLLSKRLQKLLFHIINADIYNDASSVKLKSRYPYFRRHIAHLIINGDIDQFREGERNPDSDWFLRYTKVDQGTTSPSYILGKISYEGEAILNILSEFIRFVEELTSGLKSQQGSVASERKNRPCEKRGDEEEEDSSDNTDQVSKGVSSKKLSIFDSRALKKTSEEFDFECLYEELKVIREKINTNFKREDLEWYALSVLGSSMLVDVVSARAITGDVAIRERIMEDNIASEFSSDQENVIVAPPSAHMKTRVKELQEREEPKEGDENDPKNRKFNACCICGVRRNTVLRGSLLPWRNGYVHSECVLWSVSDVYLPRTFNFNYDNYYTLFEPVNNYTYQEVSLNPTENYNEVSEATTVCNEVLSETSDCQDKYDSEYASTKIVEAEEPSEVNQKRLRELSEEKRLCGWESALKHRSEVISLDDEERVDEENRVAYDEDRPLIEVLDSEEECGLKYNDESVGQHFMMNVREQGASLVHGKEGHQSQSNEQEDSSYEHQKGADAFDSRHYEYVNRVNVPGVEYQRQAEMDHQDNVEGGGDENMLIDFGENALISNNYFVLDKSNLDYDDKVEGCVALENDVEYELDKIDYRFEVESGLVCELGDEAEPYVEDEGALQSEEQKEIKSADDNEKELCNFEGDGFELRRSSTDSDETELYRSAEMEIDEDFEYGDDEQEQEDVQEDNVIQESGKSVCAEEVNEQSAQPENANLNLLSMPVLPPVQIPDAAVEKVYKTALITMCSWCNGQGATVKCANDNCKVSFHLCCAFIASSRLVHSLHRRDNPDHEYQERVLPVKMYYTRRKIWCALCFDLIAQNMVSYHLKSLANRSRSEIMTFFSLEGMSSSAIRIACRQTLQSVRIIPRLVDYKKLDLYLSYNSKLYSKTKAMYSRALVNHPHSEQVKEFLEGVLKVDEKQEHENKINSEYDFQNKYFLYGADKEMTSLFSYKVQGLKFPEDITHNVYRIGALTLLNLGEALMHDQKGVLYPVGFTSVRRFWNFNYYNRHKKPRSRRKTHSSDESKSETGPERPNSTPELKSGEEEAPPHHEHERTLTGVNKNIESEIWESEGGEGGGFNKKRDFGNSERSFYLCSIRALDGNPYFTIDLISHPCTNMTNRRLSQGNDLKEVFASFKKVIGSRNIMMDAESFFGLNLHIVLQQLRLDLSLTMMRRFTQFTKIATFKNSLLGSRPTKYDISVRLGDPKVNYPFKISKQLMLEHITTSIEYRDNEQSVVETTDSRANRSRSRKQLESGNTSTQYRYLVSMLPEQRLDVRPSIIHGLGLFASVPINAGEPVVEYVGELIRDVIGDQREEIYSEGQGGDGSCYMFRLDDQLIVDATRKGNMSRFINHSCDPNCLCRIITCENGLKHIVVFAKSDLDPGDEITYDYQFGVESETRKLMCLCGAPNCLGRMN